MRQGYFGLACGVAVAILHRSVAFVLLTIFVIAACLVSGCSKAVPEVRVSFKGVTNRPNGSFAAVVNVQNVGGVPVQIEGYVIEIKEQARRSWRSTGMTTPVRNLLSVRQTTAVSVTYPQYDNAWRVRLYYTEMPNKSALFREKVARFLEGAKLSGIAKSVRPAAVKMREAFTRELTLKDLLFPNMDRQPERRLI